MPPVVLTGTRNWLFLFGDALRALPGADLLFDEHGELRPLVNLFLDRVLERNLAAPLRRESEVRVVAAIAGG